MQTGLRSLFHLLKARLSRRIALWIFLSIVVVEAIILLPSISRREAELLQHLEDVGLTGVAPLLRLCGSQINAEKIQQVAHQLMLESRIAGGAVYRSDGELLATFGEPPELKFTDLMGDRSRRFRTPDGNRYDVAMPTTANGNPYLLIVRLDSSRIQGEIQAFIVRICGLVIIICIFVTLATLLALGPTAIAPILNLRNALIAVGQAPGKVRGNWGDFSLAVNRQDELGEVMRAFNSMNQQIGSYLAQIRERERELERLVEELGIARDQAEKLLLNILPKSIAQQLKQGVYPIAESFEEATVLFADLVGFTQLSSQISAVKLVELLNQIFSRFDQLAQQHRLEKIKTIGDAYMVVAGVPEIHSDGAGAIARMALDMQAQIRHLSAETGVELSIRIGIHSGPVVAGAIGIQKFSYDLWGDTVNIASRMESHGIRDCIQVSEGTYLLLRDRFRFEYRGAIDVKGKGIMNAYLLMGVLEIPATDPEPASAWGDPPFWPDLANDSA